MAMEVQFLDAQNEDKCKTAKERWGFESIMSICEQLKQRLGGKPDNLSQKND